MKTQSNIMAGLLVASTCFAANAAQWSTTEVHFQYGELTEAFSDEDRRTTIITLQHASGWEYGSNFFFVDHISDPVHDEFYGEWYSTFSAKKILDAEFSGPFRDVGFVMGFNAAPEVDEVKYLPGLQIDWEVPGFAFLNTLFTGYIDDGSANAFGTEEDNSFMFDVAWKYPFNVGSASFSIEGHAEYITERNTQNGTSEGKAKSWILAQPQIRWDAGKTLFDKEGKFYLGIEYQYWSNKLGSNTDDNAVQLLAVWNL
jgi:hypothetical protein